MIFNHLHCHTQYSLLDGAASIKNMYKKAAEDGMRAIAITDHGNMFGVFDFVAEAAKHDHKIKPIVGCEFYLVADRHKRQFTKEDKDRRYHQLFLAKNAEGYQNLTKMCSLGYIEGLYGKYPRIDKELVLQYHTGLIATTCCIGAEVPQTILKKGETEARKAFEWWLNIFGEDYYIELQRHNLKEQEIVNQTLLKFAKEYNVKVIASNDSHYVDEKDANAHDILLCINTGEKQSTPKMDDFVDDGSSAKGYRFAFANNQFYFKNTQEMSQLFVDVPQAIDNTNEIVDKIDTLKLKKDILLPHFQIPKGFANQDEYLRHITYEGAYKRYGDVTPEIKERIDFELFTVQTMGFAGYFLIVADFIKAGREIGVFVGPGRGSAAGSVVAYCIGITNIDPIKYNLLFERFLNPDRKSMPDIDTDFDDEGRQKVIDYVVQKYGKQQVAHIITYGTMAAKMSIKDVARVMDLPLPEANALAKLVPDKAGIELKRIFNAPITGEGSLTEKENLPTDDLENVKKLRELIANKDLTATVLKEALTLEGSVRNTGIHAAGIIIAPKDLTEIIPVCTAKDVNLLVTQFEGNIIEDAGVIKMDFLGLKTLTIMRDALLLIKQNHHIDIDIDNIPLNDPKTYELYQKGETNGTFQFESTGMQKYLKDLKPDVFDDLIAMNALYRPGPLEYIPSFISRKHGREKVTYDLPEMEEFLKDTYGITVYQEQVMLLSQKLANFSKGDADVLRKAMGKKQKSVLDKMKTQFMDGCKKNNHPTDKAEKIWTDWEAFAAYAFNKSHSTCYAFVAYQTAYLKAHYPAEYMAAVLTNNRANIDKISFFMEECKKMNIAVKSPDINESQTYFTVNKKGEIRFAIAAVKGVGDAAVQALIEERTKHGDYKSIFDLTQRSNLRAVNKKTLESLCMAGAFDGFGAHRAQYFITDNQQLTTIDKAIKHGNQAQAAAGSQQASIFDIFAADNSQQQQYQHHPELPSCAEWSLTERLKYEKEVVGIFISGHPLDEYATEINCFANASLDRLDDFKNKNLQFAAIITTVTDKITQRGKPFCRITLEDYKANTEITLFSEDNDKFRHLINPDDLVFIKAKYQPAWNSSSQFELKITDIQPLQNLANKAQKIILELNIQQFNQKTITSLQNICTQHKGNTPLAIKVTDPDSQNQLQFVSQRYKIDAGKTFFKAIKDIENIVCTLL